MKITIKENNERGVVYRFFNTATKGKHFEILGWNWE